MAENTGERITPEPYTFLEDPEQREVLKRRAVDLARAAKGKPTVIFLDRTARPLAHLLNLVYPIVNPDTHIPKFRFLNIGSEKADAPPFDNVSGLMQSFGADNVITLKKTLQSDKPEERLIVDEVSITGATETLTKKIVEVADPQNHYSFFMFLESKEDKDPFTHIVRTAQDASTRGLPSLPWGGITALEENESDRKNNLSFTLSGTHSENGRKEIRKLYNDFKMLASEIRKEVVR